MTTDSFFIQIFFRWDVGELPATLNFQFVLPASLASENDPIFGS